MKESENAVLLDKPFLEQRYGRKWDTVGNNRFEIRVNKNGILETRSNSVFGGILLFHVLLFTISFWGYWRNPKKTAEEFTVDGYFITGDVGKIDDKGTVGVVIDLLESTSAGYVSILGRGKDLIISGGLNVYPKQVLILFFPH